MLDAAASHQCQRTAMNDFPWKDPTEDEREFISGPWNTMKSGDHGAETDGVELCDGATGGFSYPIVSMRLPGLARSFPALARRFPASARSFPASARLCPVSARLCPASARSCPGSAKWQKRLARRFFGSRDGLRCRREAGLRWRDDLLRPREPKLQGEGLGGERQRPTCVGETFPRPARSCRTL